MKKRRTMFSIILIAVGLAVLHGLSTRAAAYRVDDTTLPNGWRISPAGRLIKLSGDLPVKIASAGDRHELVVTTAGFHHHAVTLVDVDAGKVVQSLTVAQLSPGLLLLPRGEILVSSGLSGADYMKAAFARKNDPPDTREPVNGDLLRLTLANGKLSLQQPLVLSQPGLKPDRYISGVAKTRDGKLLVLDPETDKIYKADGHSGKVRASAATGYAPMHLAVSPDGREVAVSNWGDASVYLYSTSDLRQKAQVKVGLHPNELTYAKDGRLFVANASSNSVSVIHNGKVAETIKTSLTPDALIGSTPNALAVSPDGRTLYIANADNNNFAVVDISRPGESQIAGFVPTGWYPSALAASPDGKQIYVGVGKGIGMAPNPTATVPGPDTQPDPKRPYDYVGDTLAGYIEVVNVPDSQALAEYSHQVRANVPSPSAAIDPNQKTSVETNVFPKIKHVVFIIRENRTYDQVFGDIGKGNSEPSLTMFGADVTPNAHEIAGKGTLLDNLYSSGEVSQNGHEWANSAYSTEYNSKGWVQGYSGHRYISRRQDNDYRKLSAKLESSPAGYLWDNCARHNVSYISYGEYVSFRSSRDEAPVFQGAEGLNNHYSVGLWHHQQEIQAKLGPYPKDVKDRVAWYLKRDSPEFHDTATADVFIAEMRAAEASGNWPSYMVMTLGEDHTAGLTPGASTPKAAVAWNDQALGKIVEAISHSKFWAETAIFVVEDDAQNGPDHVDARRTVGLVISPWVKRDFVDHTMYTTVSMVRTMEMILGLPPMTQFDEHATPMYAAFTDHPDLTAYANLGPRTELAAHNPLTGVGATASLKLDFSDYDRADPDELNRILWEALKPGVPMPAPVRSLAGAF